MKISNLVNQGPQNYSSQMIFYEDDGEVDNFPRSAKLHLKAANTLFKDELYRDGLLSLYSSMECYFKYLYILALPKIFSDAEIKLFFYKSGSSKEEIKEPQIFNFVGDIYKISHHVPKLVKVIHTLVDFEDELLNTHIHKILLALDEHKTKYFKKNDYTILRYQDNTSVFKEFYEVCEPSYREVIEKYSFIKGENE